MNRETFGHWLRAAALGSLFALAGCDDAEGTDTLDDGNAAADPVEGSGDDDPGSATDTPEALVDLIRTDTDPDDVYEFEKTKFVPEDGKVLLIVGQTIGGINEHVASFPEQPLPGGWAAYWGVPSLDGVTSDFVGEQGGLQNHQTLVDNFPNTVLQSAMWMVGTWDVAKRTGDGEFDAVIRGYGQWVQSTGRPVYLRIGYEFDGPHNALEPEHYVRAYRRVVDILREEGVENVAYVWHSYASPPYKGYPISEWYPGDDYVDWVGVSVFGHMYRATPSAELDAVLRFARQHRKPVMIAEASPINGISRTGDASWRTWFTNMFSLTYERNIKAISFINEDWERFNFPGVNWSDARLQNNEQIAEAWFLETNRDRYLKQSPELYQQLGYEP